MRKVRRSRGKEMKGAEFVLFQTEIEVMKETEVNLSEVRSG